MGMFLDNTRPSRSEWKFLYKGKDLLAAAQRKLATLEAQLHEAQTNLKAAVAKSSRLHGDEDAIRWEKQVERLGPETEACQVFVHEFYRVPDREYNLSSSDVTYFDLHEDAPLTLEKVEINDAFVPLDGHNA